MRLVANQALVAWTALGRRDALTLAGILVATLVLHGQVVRAPFFADDYLFLEQVRHRSLGPALISPDPIGNFFRPVSRTLWFWLASRAGGETPALFHALNLALFAALLADRKSVV